MFTLQFFVTFFCNYFYIMIGIGYFFHFLLQDSNSLVSRFFGGSSTGHQYLGTTAKSHGKDCK